MAFIAPNEVLACCSIPQTNIDIEFDYLLAQTQQASKKKPLTADIKIPAKNIPFRNNIITVLTFRREKSITL